MDSKRDNFRKSKLISNSYPEKDDKKGLILINTGNGKGKTTAALGLALRAAGNNLKVLVLQFIKGPWKSGEVKIIEKLKPLIEIEQLGTGFIKFEKGRPVITKEDTRNAVESFKYACDKINCRQYDMVILDEISNLIDYGLLDTKDVVNLLENKPEELCVVLTGRNAPRDLVNIADTVTEMKEIKHAFNKSIKARKGIEY